MKADDPMLSRLMALSQAGDGVAYRTLLDCCRTWLRRYFERRILPAGIDDLVQDTLISLHRKRSSYDPSRPFLPWLAAIARYRWVDHLRQVYRAAETQLPPDCAVESDEDAVMARISLGRMLALLPDGQASAIRLVKIEGLSISEASARCGQSEPLVKVNIHRGLKRLAVLIESE